MNEQIIRDEYSTYHISDHIPAGYEIWNIGLHNAPKGYVPLAMRMTQDRDDPEYHHINPDTIIAVKCEPDIRRAVMEIASYVNTPESAKRYLKRLQESDTKLSQFRAQYVAERLPALETFFEKYSKKC